MMRTIRPKDENAESESSIANVPEAAKSSKRRCVSSACIPCRKRKSKCDGETPECSTCTAVYHTECSYDIDSDHRRKAALKKDIEKLKEQNGALEVIVTALKSSSDSEVSDIIQQLRAEEDVEAIAETLKTSITLPDKSDSKSSDRDLSNIIGSPASDESGVMKHFGSTSNLALVSDIDKSPTHPHIVEAWTDVTDDSSLIEHLMGLYFCWSHPFYMLFSKELFYHDLKKRRGKYCSPLLVNAVLAVACAYSDRPDTRSNPSDAGTTGDNFFGEAKRLLNTTEASSLTTVQALALMGLREASCNRDSSAFSYAGRSMRMAIELGLHISLASHSNNLSPTELEVRKMTFWGLFTFDTAWSICIGRISQLPRSAISIDMPNILDQLESKPWNPFTDYDVDRISNTQQPCYAHTFLHQFSLLSKIVNDVIFMFYAPRERFTSKKLLGYHEKYVEWFDQLPSVLQLQHNTMPHVLVLHMYYHTVILHLFRPFLKLDIRNSISSPKDECTRCANTVANLLSTYRETYGLRHTTMLIPHIILSSNIIDLVNIPDRSAAKNLKHGITALRECTQTHPFAKRCSRILTKLVKQWNIELPADVSQELYKSSPQKSSSNGIMMDGIHQPAPSKAWSPTSITNSAYAQQPEHSMRRASNVEMPYYSTSTTSTSSSQQPTDLYWSPFPDHSVPLQIMQQNGAMDISAMIDTQNGQWDHLGRDGFSMSMSDNAILATGTYCADGQGGYMSGVQWS